MDLLLGLDVGTTATKALLLDLQGNIVASATYDYGLITLHEGWVEQNPQDLWNGVIETLRAVQSHVRPGDRIVALSQSSQGGTTIPVDNSGQPTYNAISWMDNRAGEHLSHVRETWGADAVYHLTGWPLNYGLPLQHIAWLRLNRRDVFEASRYFLFVNDFIIYHLTGQYCMNPSDGGITQLMDVAQSDWHTPFLDFLGITSEQLSPIHSSGYTISSLTVEASDLTGLPESVLVVNGAHDQYCAAVGAGVFQPGQVLLSSGTAWVVLGVTQSLEEGLSSGLSVSRHPIQGRWGIMRSLAGVGTSLEWFANNIWCQRETKTERKELYAEINQAVARSTPGANRLLFFPLSGGHLLSYEAGGGFMGLSLSHSVDDMARAVMEGVAFELRWALQEAQKTGIEFTQLRMVGGAAESSIWPQIVADVTGLPVHLPTVKQAAGYGAAILAGVGANLFTDPETGFHILQGSETRLEPNLENYELYTNLFGRYQKLFNYLCQR